MRRRGRELYLFASLFQDPPKIFDFHFDFISDKELVSKRHDYYIPVLEICRASTSHLIFMLGHVFMLYHAKLFFSLSFSNKNMFHF